MKYYIVVGEASGDLHASNLMKALKAEDDNADFRFFGGDLMNEVGGQLVRHYRDLAYMGFIPVLLHLRTIMRGLQQCKDDIVKWKPDVLILVDYPGFNLNIAKFIHKNTNIPIYYYISPKIWAWKEHRIKAIKRDVDKIFSILPFEVEWYKKRDYPANKISYVGNPCVDAVSEFLCGEYGNETFKDFCERNNLERKPIIAILSGSRKQEIRDNLKIMIEAASEFDEYQLVIAGAPGIDYEFYKRQIRKMDLGEVDPVIIFDQTYRILRQSTAALVTSGTATLETALLRIPQVVCYYIPCGKIVNIARKLFLKVPFISLVNLIAGDEVVTELVADGMNVDGVRQSLYDILPGSEKREIMPQEYDDVIKRLGNVGASTRAAKQIFDSLNQ